MEPTRHDRRATVGHAVYEIKNMAAGDLINRAIPPMRKNVGIEKSLDRVM
jgi:hypothetical protein